MRKESTKQRQKRNRSFYMEATKELLTFALYFYLFRFAF